MGREKSAAPSQTASRSTAAPTAKGAAKATPKTEGTLVETVRNMGQVLQKQIGNVATMRIFGPDGQLAFLADIRWVDKLPAFLQDQIIKSFSEEAEQKTFAKQRRNALAAEDKAAKKRKDAETRKRIGHDRIALSPQRLKKERRRLEKKRTREPEKVAAELAAIDAALGRLAVDREAYTTAETVRTVAESTAPDAEPGRDGHQIRANWIDGRKRAKLDFHHWAVAVLGSPEAAEQHFTAIEPLPKELGSAPLHRVAAARLGEAKKDFEKRHKTVSFPQAHVGQALRVRHQKRHSSGMLGHPLGISLDYFPRDNPHLMTSRPLVEAIGGSPYRLEFRDARGKPLDNRGRQRRVRALAKETTAGITGEARSEESQEFLRQLRDGYAAMVATSEAIKRSLSIEGKAELRELAETYWSTTKAQLERLGKDLRRVSKKRSVAEKAARRSIKARARNEIKAAGGDRALVAEAERARDEALASGLVGEPQMMAVDAEQAALEAEIVALEDGLRSELTRILDPIQTILDDRIAALPEEDGPKRAKLVALKARLLDDPDFVFGEPKKRRKRTRRGKSQGKWVLGQAERPSLLQLLERGFARNDPIPEPGGEASGADKKEAFNGAFIEVMAEHGFAPGAAFTKVDTMHFDFAEGFDAFSGGRGASYGPRGVRKRGRRKAR